MEAALYMSRIKHVSRDTEKKQKRKSTSDTDSDSHSSSTKIRRVHLLTDLKKGKTKSRQSGKKKKVKCHKIKKKHKYDHKTSKKKEKHKRKHVSSSSSDDDSTDSSSDESSQKKLKKHRKLKKSESCNTTNEKEDGSHDCYGPSIPKTVLQQQQIEKSRLLAPMTKEEWEKQQNCIRRVYDTETGRNRLVRGDSEIIEECVSRESHKKINKQATAADGMYFQERLKE